MPMPGMPDPSALPVPQGTPQSLGQVPYGPGGAMIPSGQTAGSPGPGGAMSDAGTAISQAVSQAVRTLMNNLAPASVKDIQKKVAALTQQGEGGPTAKIAGQNAPLGNQFGPTGGAPNP